VQASGAFIQGEVPITTEGLRMNASISRGPVSFEHVVGEGHKRARERQAKVFGRLKVEHKFIAAWLFERKFARLGPAKHARRVDGETSIDAAPVNAI
jgi:hypothetical protein